MQCSGCMENYIGETTNLRLRTNVHRDHIRRNTGLYVSRHIHTCSQNNYNFKIMPFYKIHSEDDSLRKMKETYFIEQFQPKLNQTT